MISLFPQVEDWLCVAKLILLIITLNGNWSPTREANSFLFRPCNMRGNST